MDPRRVIGPFLEVDHPEDWHYVDVWNHQPILVRRAAGKTRLIMPEELADDMAVVVGMPANLRVVRQGDSLHVDVRHAIEDARIQINTVDNLTMMEEERLDLPASGGVVRIDDLDLDFPYKVLVKLMQDGVMVDEVIMDLGWKQFDVRSYRGPLHRTQVAFARKRTMGTDHAYLPGNQTRGRWLRIDSARILKRLFFCERALITAQAGWLPAIESFEVKTTLPRFLWEDSLIAHALRDRVFELKFPSRMLEIGDDAPLIDAFEAAVDAPGPEAFVWSLAYVFKPALRDIYRLFCQEVDVLSSGPIRRHVRVAAMEKAEQVAWLEKAAGEVLAAAPWKRQEAEAWAKALSGHLDAVGGVSFDAPTRLVTSDPSRLPGRRPFKQVEAPARDARFHRTRYYWPDIIDPTFHYGEGMRLQLRSAISHINEIWAVETAGAILHEFADDLGWDDVVDAARWTYDEARHTRMGFERLKGWGFEPSEIPLGRYAHECARGEDPIVRLGMLYHFETKNIGKKTRRRDAFGTYRDRVSQHDMDYDWADEVMHTRYGTRWIHVLGEKHPERMPDIRVLRDHCERLVAREVADATDEDRQDIRVVAEALISEAEHVRVSS